MKLKIDGAPSAVKLLPDAAQRLYLDAFNSNEKKAGEEVAHAIAWNQVHRKYKCDGDNWTTRDSEPVEYDMRSVSYVGFDDAASIHKSADGFIVARPRVARVGIQDYYGFELGLTDHRALDIIKVYRAPDEVFAKDSAQTMTGRPITIDHPPEFVTSSNWRDFSVGHSGDEVLRDGEYLRVPMMVCDGDAVEAVHNGKAQLSVGYSAVLKWGRGSTPAGEVYDAMQTNIRVNHFAIVKRARGGANLNMRDSGADNQQRSMKETRKMLDRTILVDGVSVTLPATEATVVERHISALKDGAAVVQKALDAATAAHQAAIATKDTEIAELKKQLGLKDAEIVTLKKAIEDSKVTPKQLEDMARNHVATSVLAKRILGDSYQTAGKTLDQMRKDVVVARLGDDAKNWDDGRITASFDTIATLLGNGNGNGGGAVTQAVDSASQLANIFSASPAPQSSQVLDSAYAEYEKRISSAYQGVGASPK